MPPGPHLLSSVILDSPILAGDRGIPDELAGVPGGGGAGGSGGGGAGGGAGGSQFEFGVDPSLDPELAMVRPPLVLLSFVIALDDKFLFFVTGAADVHGRGGSAPSGC